MEREEMTKLEQMIDRNGLSSVLEAMADVCREKAAHIRENWQDSATARPWDQNALNLENLLRKLA